MTSLVTTEHRGVTVKAPVSFIVSTEKERKAICNGMGPSGKGWMVPDTMYGLDMGAAGDVHDWMYTYPDWLSRKSVDGIFLSNMYSIIEAHDGWGWVNALRRMRARKYYAAVRIGGAVHFKTMKVYLTRPTGED